MVRQHLQKGPAVPRSEAQAQAARAKTDLYTRIQKGLANAGTRAPTGRRYQCAPRVLDSARRYPGHVGAVETDDKLGSPRGRMPVFSYLRDVEVAAAYMFLVDYPPQAGTSKRR
jgi:hypothetical protein